MSLRDLFILKENLLKDIRTDVKPEDFSTNEAYWNHIHAAEEGVMRFFVNAMIHLMDSDSEQKKKSA